MRIVSGRELREWDRLVRANPDGGHILQTRAWGEFKARHGWRPLYTIHGDEPGIATLFLRRQIPGLGELWYAPKGPGATTSGQLLDVTRSAVTLGKPFVIKVEPEIRTSSVDTDSWKRAGLRPARTNIQISQATIIVDLRADEDALLASFKPKCRYNIRLAARRGVVVEPVEPSDANLDTMFELMAATQARAGFTLRSRDYFRGYWRLQTASSQAQLFFASYRGTVLAGVFATFFGNRGWYKDGGSTKAHHDLMAPHLLQWEVMRWLRARGVEFYDLVAVPPADQVTDSHPLFGLYRFKSGFSDAITEFVGTWDFPVQRRRYDLWERAGERVAHAWCNRVRHDLFY